MFFNENYRKQYCCESINKQNKKFRNPIGKFKNMYLEYGNWNTKPALTTNKIIMETC